MRMWMISPKFICRKHLLGEHNEIHKHLHIFKKRYSITGRIKPKTVIEPENLKKRHDELAIEILRRGYNHKSPLNYEDLPDLSYLPNEERYAKVNINESVNDMIDRCNECRKKLIKN